MNGAVSLFLTFMVCVWVYMVMMVVSPDNAGFAGWLSIGFLMLYVMATLNYHTD